MAKGKVTVDQIMDIIHARKMEQVKILEQDEKEKELSLMKWGIATGRKYALDELYREIMDLEYAAING